MFATLANLEAGNRITKGFISIMATQTNGSKSAKPKAKSTAKRKSPTAAKKPARTGAAETAVDIPVGAVLTVADRVAELVEPFGDRRGTEKQLKSYRTRLRRQVKRTERRGATARRRATGEARRATGEARKAIEARTSRAQGLVDRVGERISALR